MISKLTPMGIDLHDSAPENTITKACSKLSIFSWEIKGSVRKPAKKKIVPHSFLVDQALSYTRRPFFLMCVSFSTQTKSRQGLGKRLGCVVSWEGHLILGQTEARRAGRQKLFLLSGHCPSPYLSVWISHGPHLLEDLNPPMESWSVLGTVLPSYTCF